MLKEGEMSLEQLYKMLHVSKRKAAWMLNNGIMHSITERDAFSYGFRLGVQLMAESFLLPLGEDENL